MMRSLARRARPLANRVLEQYHTSNPVYQPIHLSKPTIRISATMPCSHSGRRHITLSARFSHTAPPSHESTEETEEDPTSPEPIERLPLPPGVPADKFGLYELLHTSQDWKNVTGENAVVGVHGPEELWVPEGTKNEGAAGGVFAVVAAGGTQHKVTPGDVLYVNRMPGEVNEKVQLTEVLLVGAYDWTVFGRPLIKDACVVATVEEQTLSGKVMVTKFKKRKGYTRRKGHRQPITRMRIEEVRFEFPSADEIVPYEVPYDPRRPPLPNHIRSL